MSRSLFGTDGIRGVANKGPLQPDGVLRLAMATGAVLRNGEHRHTVVVAKDTRVSGYMIEMALASGFVSMGMNVVLAGPMPTPAVAMLVRSHRADLGVMISASHNAFADNGIKLFGPDGFKLSDEVEADIERAMQGDLAALLVEPAELGNVRRLEDVKGRYIEFVKASFPRDLSLDGLKIVVDCAHGAAHRLGRPVLEELGATVETLGVAPNGLNINDGVGAVHTEAMQQAVVAAGADIGIALDGDADRLVVSDERGQRIDGDQLLAVIARNWAATKRLRGGGVVATVMSNLGLERFLDDLGLTLARTPVGDRYVVSRMMAEGYNLGGEQSGHIVLSDYATTGDGLLAALQVLAVLQTEQRPASEVMQAFTPVPQVLKNVRFDPAVGNPLHLDAVQKAKARVEASLEGIGRLLVRKSGTEPLIRVMAEGDDAARIEAAVDEMIAAVDAAAH